MCIKKTVLGQGLLEKCNDKIPRKENEKMQLSILPLQKLWDSLNGKEIQHLQ